ncbi:MAG: hypothetical protein Q7V62_08090 [Actinomycetota bacterium]|nr:hypothetical protein [Actinomycetota bacterium]
MCGAVTFTVHGELRDVWNCHCHRCRRFTGHHMAGTSAALSALTITGDTLTYEELSDTWLDELLKKEDHALAHVHTDGGLLISASGEEIRAFITKYSAEAKAWKAATVWKKKP